MPLRLTTALPALTIPLIISLSAEAQASSCPAPGQWLDGKGTPVATDVWMRDLADQQVVMLGEQHDRLAHHRWQLQTLAGLHALHPDMVIGLEMLPRKAQPVLDDWVAGDLSEAAFLEASDWSSTWGYDPALYWPILHFARMQGVPLKALNVSAELRQRLVEEGWQAVPAADRFDMTAPAPASPAYRAELADVFAAHDHAAETDDADLERFIDAQLVWDRAMASGLAEASAEGKLVVGLMGLRHLSDGHGVPHQLDDLGVAEHRSLLPRRFDDACQPPPAGRADGFFILDGRWQED
ncbi:ChaN family lipoprotein [Halomonas elongata]|uniref:ChaN family lipoprotein n=1 Tax=Halomonas elongata TaxID=2746 RepID=UPI00186BA283|nr:ChaN family lipoprotein [Halomonas elongata]MBW5798911.1 ChaN family lipoprotein [Halomonas elongata]